MHRSERRLFRRIDVARVPPPRDPSSKNERQANERTNLLAHRGVADSGAGDHAGSRIVCSRPGDHSADEDPRDDDDADDHENSNGGAAIANYDPIILPVPGCDIECFAFAVINSDDYGQRHSIDIRITVSHAHACDKPKRHPNEWRDRIANALLDSERAGSRRPDTGAEGSSGAGAGTRGGRDDRSQE